ncbi:hypothetical protein OIE63_28635 [Streptomyces sp. NBC_01795]|uniref:hypothetical protein n=1 Tax=unclassified Streptomyces TaxID=2593676 RepID=UPI002DD8F3C3|nr:MULTISPECIES: hypothetical protein [unclassified Streptomyces]WSA95076.1 hypothetical protein OIE63_28635 [Streptomyces sp. NBC_01795]WSS12299.1 hypothetical protein OG533_10465 [Streptomyces sp. NBC_01186]
MTDEHGDAAERLAVVCEYLDEIRRDLRSGPGGGDTAVEQVLAAVRNGADAADSLDGLHAVLQVGGDPWGLNGYAGDGSGTRGLQPAGISRPNPGEHVYVCPADRCTRYWWLQQATAPVPHCHISGTVLRRKRL